MSEDLWATREDDALLHTSVMADILGGVGLRGDHYHRQPGLFRDGFPRDR